MANGVYKFKGEVTNFGFDGPQSGRSYLTGRIRYGNLRKYVASEPFDAKTGNGEQRAVIEPHAKKLKKEMSVGKYVPTFFTFGTRQKHRDSVQLTKTGESTVATIEVSEDFKLPLLDGGNRSHALELLRSESKKLATEVDNLYIPYVLILDGNTKEDFVALQEHKPVSKDHMLSVRIANGLMDKKHSDFMKMALDIAQILHAKEDSFCEKIIQFDSQGTKLPLSLNSLCSKAASEQAFSLYGSAEIAIGYKKDAEWAANCILTAYESIQAYDETVELLQTGKILAPVPYGTKAGTTLLIAIGNMLAGRLMVKATEEADDTDLQLLVDCVAEHFDLPTTGNTSADRKRKIFNGFCVDFFQDLKKSENDDDDQDDKEIGSVGFHEDIPMALIHHLSASTFNVSKVPTPPKKRGRKPKVAESGKSEEIMEETNCEINQNESIVHNEDPVDAAAFAEEDKDNEGAKARLENANLEEDTPWA